MSFVILRSVRHSVLVLLFGGALALGVRWQLAFPWQTMPFFGRFFGPEGGQISPEFYTMLFTMHAKVKLKKKKKIAGHMNQ